MDDIDFTEIKGHTLKQITIRMDFQDIIKVSDESIKKIQTACFKKNLDTTITRILSPDDFQYNDFITDISIPYEYLKQINSHAFINQEQNLIVEINQFFLKITQEVNKDYIRFSEMKELYLVLAEILKEHDEIRIKRFSLNKINEVFYENEEKLLNDFKAEMIGLNYHDDMVDWTHPHTQMNQTLNFESEGFFINIAKMVDNGAINEKTLIRLLLKFELFCLNNPNMSLTELLPEMNKIMNNLFIKHFTDTGYEKIKKAVRLGDYSFE